jgi:sulfatase maturation enzyme AslB (radical SAM superfamily)
MENDTFCSRSWTDYYIDLEFLEAKMCCRTDLKPILLDEDWTNSAELQERRQYHLTGLQHQSCNHCWNIEKKGIKSYRKNTGLHPTSTKATFGNKVKEITIKVGNICNMACRYCGPIDSSIWAERVNDTSYNKKSIFLNKNNNERELIHAQIYDWLNQEIKNSRSIIITGGEPSISPQFYNLIDKINFSNLPIMINTNLNIPTYYINKFVKVLETLCLYNNKVTLRISIDGVGDQHCWQRQGSNWELLVKNFKIISKLPIYTMISQTSTMLTLEGFGKLAEFISNSADEFQNRPKFDAITHIVNWPTEFDPTEWIPSFKDEINEFLNITIKSNLIQAELITTLNQWLELPNELPSLETVNTTIQFLNSHQEKWGSIGDWKEIYPKVNKICNLVLNK